MRTAVFGIAVLLSSYGASAQEHASQPDVQVTIPAGEGQMANCSGGIVRGLDPAGDGFLAVRAGPGTNHRMLDRLRNGEGVRLCDQRGGWIGIVYGRKGEYGGECHVNGAGPERPYTGPCHSGWAHRRWIEFVAG